MVQGKGAVGWKAPPKQTREPVVRQPTQGQTEAAKRLSQGLSVDTNKSTARSNRYVAHNILGAPTPLAVVLDPTEYQQQSMMMAGAPQGAAGYGGYASGAPQQGGAVAPGNPYQPVYGGIYPAFNRDGKPEAVWPSTKANRYDTIPNTTEKAALFACVRFGELTPKSIFSFLLLPIFADWWKKAE